MRILVVEDEAGIADFVRRGLRAEGHQVDVAADGLSGERTALTTDVDLVVLDRMLPGRDGLEVLRGIRAAKPALPVIVLTARGEVVDRVSGLDAGATDYMVKPARNACAAHLARQPSRPRAPAAPTVRSRSSRNHSTSASAPHSCFRLKQACRSRHATRSEWTRRSSGRSRSDAPARFRSSESGRLPLSANDRSRDAAGDPLVPTA